MKNNTFCSQFIIGLGIPVDLKEASVTVGTVIKFQYDVPTNSSEYTTRIYGFADTVSRDMDDGKAAENVSEKEIEGDSRNLNEADNEIDQVNNTLVDITFDKRKKRALQYSEGGVLNNIDTSEQNTELPLEEAIRRQEIVDRESLKEEPQRMNRWDYYKIIEQMAERFVLKLF